MGDSLDNAYLNSSRCNDFEPVITELVKHVRMLENRVGSGLSVSVGSTDTLEPGEDAYVTNGGTKQQARLQFGIPRGADGTPGKDGTPGAKGDKGDKGDSYTITEADYDAIATIAESDLQPKLDEKANIASPAFTGTPTVPYTNLYSAGRIVNMRMLKEDIASIESYPVGITSFDNISSDGYFSIIEYTNDKKYLIGVFEISKFEDIELLLQIDSGLFSGGVYPQLSIFNANVSINLKLSGLYIDTILSAPIYVLKDTNIDIAFANVTGFTTDVDSLKLNVVIATSNNIENLLGFLTVGIIAGLV